MVGKLTEAEQIDLAATIALLQLKGPQLPFPHSSGINNSKHSHMRELRTQHQGRPYRNPRRSTILLLGGDKTGDNDWYDKNIPIADRLYDDHLVLLKTEGLI